MSTIRFWVLGAIWLALSVGMVLWLLSKETTHLSIAAGRANSEGFELVSHIADEFEKKYPNINVEIYETLGQADSGMMLERGEVDLALIGNNFEIADGQPAQDAKAVLTLFPRATAIVTNSFSNINSIRDLADKKVAVSAHDPDTLLFLYGLMVYYGMDPASISAIRLSERSANFALQQGEVDVLFRYRHIADKLHRELLQKIPDAKLITSDLGDALQTHYPFIRDVKIPKGTFRGFPPVPTETLNMYGGELLLAANKKVDSSIIYDIAKTTFDEKASLIVKSNFASSIEPVGASSNFTFPLHKGAQRYYDREKPSLLQQNSKLLGSMIYLGVFLTSVVMGIRGYFKRAHRIQVKEYNLELIEIVEQVEKVSDWPEMLIAKNRLSEILKEVVKRLDGDEISHEEFNRFSFTWRAAERTLRNREIELSRGGSMT